MSWYGDAWDAVSDTASDAWDAATDAGEEFVDDVEEGWSDFTEDCSDAWSDFTSQPGLFNLFAAIVGTIGAVVDLIFDVVGAVVGGFFAVVGVIVGFIVGVIVSIFSPENGPKVGRWIEGALATFGDWVETVFDYAGDVIEWIFGLVASGLLWLDDFFRCRFGIVTGGPKPPPPTSFDDVGHVFVLMLENRSFDHLLGLLPNVNGWTLQNPRSNSDLNGVTRAQTDLANQALAVNPPHEFPDVQLQLNAGADTTGFAKVWHREILDEAGGASGPEIEQIMAGFSPARAPILNTLAAEFAVCDAWHCSLPGPTYPNRLFAYAGESGGLADSPRSISLATAYADGISFENGTFFDLLDHNCDSWRIYRGDAFPMVNTLKHVYISRMGDYRKINPTDANDDEYANDLASADAFFPRFVFIEPDYGDFINDFRGGNSQHPLDGCAPGERLIKHVYEHLRSSPIWERSMLIITYDEHGGFYDHVTPPGAFVPNTDNRHQDLADDVDFSHYSAARYGISLTNDQLNPKKFKFDRLGPRVPAVVVSPLIPKGTVSSETYDHTTIIRTYCDLYGRDFLAQRDRLAVSLRGLFTEGGVRQTPATLPPVNIA